MVDQPKYQATRMWGEYNFTVRADTFEEFKQALSDIKPLIDGIKAKEPETSTQTAYKPKKTEEGWCDYHKCPMYKNKNGKLYHMRGKGESAEFCNGRGYPSDKEEWKEHTTEVRKTLTPEPEDEDISGDVPF